jgi:hypothetical protein
VVVLEHDHARQIVSMRVDAPDQHPVLFDQPEPGSGLSRSGNDAFVACVAREIFYTFRSALEKKNQPMLLET